jgi:hypothetical protein
MDTTTLITSDGPYVHALLRDVLPPDWEALRRELEREIEDGAQQVTIALSRASGISPTDEHLLDIRDRLERAGIATTIIS